MGEGAAATGIGSAANALRVLLLLKDRRSVRVTDVSDELGVGRSTAHRLLATLVQYDFVTQDRATRAYRPGRVFFELGLAAVGDLEVRRKSRRHVERLSAAVGETVHLLVLEGPGARFVDGVEGEHPVRVGLRIGQLLPASTTSGGKALLAELPFEDVKALYPDGLPRLTEETITLFCALESELQAVREQGYALNRSESTRGLTAVAVVIRDARERAVAALAVSMPSAHLAAGDLPLLVASIGEAAEAIGADLR
ncbi:IclR family transcriptional regulator (plasmid) [Rhodococcus antarcticus]|jgi:DNA-binding IclR family transcriptional regulator|uniref:IclR family transcriptional regulator n=1 Tax=Rhodococcus antarcticus TaxID=2987751 RepID=A0ABY6P6K9_9NOCA|nr:IclR family transcriptional regulator [Rhodococcus antarcticus]UZJ26818.1 IclR family transcriptional regulator [Rhodococcus antarcticus]